MNWFNQVIDGEKGEENISEIITDHKFLLSTGYCCATNDGVSFIIFIKKTAYNLKNENQSRKCIFTTNTCWIGVNETGRHEHQDENLDHHQIITWMNSLQFLHDKIFSKSQLTCRKSLDMLKPKWSAFECCRQDRVELLCALPSDNLALL